MPPAATMKTLARILTLSFAVAWPVAFAAPAELGSAESGSTLEGTVTTQHSGKPIPGARVEIVGRRQVAVTNADGHFRFAALPAGVYVLSVEAVSYAHATTQVQVDGSNDAATSIVLDLIHEEHIVVTASADPQDALRAYQPTSILGRQDLERRGAVALGTTLANEPGISNDNLGIAPARPVIRGLGGDRVLILEDGTRIGDVSSLSPDHAVAVDPAAADSVEIIRGPANLLYGSGAIGGVINVVNQEVPTRLLQRPTGSLMISGGSNADEVAAVVDLEASAGPVGFRVGGTRREGDDFETGETVAGNSDYDTTGANAGVSLVGDGGSIGVAYRDFDADYGIPVSESGTPIPPGDRGVRIDMEEQNLKLLGEITRQFGGFEGARLQVSSRDYTHAEIEDTGAVGTVFNLDSTEFRADLRHQQLGRWQGSFGVWYLDQDFEAVGAEVLVPKANTRGIAGFVYEELKFERASYLFGGRFESRDVEQTVAMTSRDFDDFAAAFGARFQLGEPVELGFTLNRSAKFPTAEELFADGPHLATAAFEVGDPNLIEEVGRGIDITLGFKTESRFDGELTLFATRIDDFIFLMPTGMIDVDSGLEIFDYEQDDADFIGAEWHGDIFLAEHLTLEILADYVRAENRRTSEPLPFITPPRAGVGLNWASDRYFLGGEVRAAARQDRVAPNETETAGYAIYNLFGGVSIPAAGLVHRFTVRLENITDKLYRNHVSRTKDIVAQQGFNAVVAYRLLY